jgi:hypothetical protein
MTDPIDLELFHYTKGDGKNAHTIPHFSHLAKTKCYRILLKEDVY